MTYSDGTFLTVMGKSWDIAVIDSITVDNSEVTDNAVDLSLIHISEPTRLL